MPNKTKPTFMNGKFPVQKYAIIEYLEDDFDNMVKFYAHHHYELPATTREERYEIEQRIKKSSYTKDIFATAKNTKLFLKELEDNFANNGSDSFSYTCRCAGENGVFHYYEKAQSTYEKNQNKDVERIFSGLLDKWAEHYANSFVNLYDDVHTQHTEEHNKQELAELERLAKKTRQKNC